MISALKKNLSLLFSSPKSRWLSAQTEEAKFWEGISKTGYNNQDPAMFIEDSQKRDMLSALNFLDIPNTYWLDKTVIEFGPGPAGVIEYIDAKEKIGIEPLYLEYFKMFPHLKFSKVKYFPIAAEETEQVPSQCADLVICYNMLDHVIEPSKVLHQIKRVIKSDGILLFQINVYDSDLEIQNKSGVHADLHPHSFTRDSITNLLDQHGFKVTKESLAEWKNECDERFFICSCLPKGKI